MPLTRPQAHEIDRCVIDEFGMPSLLLMENAGRGVVDVLDTLGIKGPIVVCCGTGNNGGDGFVVARHLDLRSRSVRVALFGDTARMTADAATNFAIIEKCGIAIERFGSTDDAQRLAKQLDGAACIVDALLGTGARGEPRPPLDVVIDQINAAAALRVAVDLPSGLDCDAGVAAQHTIRAHYTCTFVDRKIGFDAPSAAAYIGTVHVCDIGAPRVLVSQVTQCA